MLSSKHSPRGHREGSTSTVSSRATAPGPAFHRQSSIAGGIRGAASGARAKSSPSSPRAKGGSSPHDDVEAGAAEATRPSPRRTLSARYVPPRHTTKTDLKNDIVLKSQSQQELEERNEKWTELVKQAYDMRYERIVRISSGRTTSAANVQIVRQVRELLTLRHKYLYQGQSLPEGLDLTKIAFKLEEGVFRIVDANDSPVHDIADLYEFNEDLNHFWLTQSRGAFRMYANKRMEILEKRFEIHRTLNYADEAEYAKMNNVDFYSWTKVDNHIHGAACMTSYHLVKYIKRAIEEDQAKGTSGRLLVNVNLDDMNIDDLGTRSGPHMFQNFDNFNASYNPFGDSHLRKIFLKTDNELGGEYFAKLLLEVGDNLAGKATGATRHAMDANIYYEPRLSVYGRNIQEWSKLATWAKKWGMFHERFMWMIQIPRAFPVWLKMGKVKSFEDWINNIFQPMFMATMKPDIYPEIAEFLNHIVAFDSVDNEAIPDMMISDIPPQDYIKPDQPSYSYYSYFLWANLFQLNLLRKSKGMNTFAFRPHCGECGCKHHLGTAFLLAKSINHGIQLNEEPGLQYLYYLAKIGLSVSPLSNNALFLPLEHSPFYSFFKRGLNVTLSTDDPLQFHTSSSPLLEEYATAKQRWRLVDGDLAEIARNSILQSGFTDEKKASILGEHFRLGGPAGNDCGKTDVTPIRSAFRMECYLEELNSVFSKSLIYFDKQAGLVHGWEKRLPQENKKTMPGQGSDRQINANESALRKLNRDYKGQFVDRNTSWQWTPSCPVFWQDLVVHETGLPRSPRNC